MIGNYICDPEVRTKYNEFYKVYSSHHIIWVSK